MRNKPEYISIAKFEIEDFISIMDLINPKKNGNKRKFHWQYLILNNQLTCPSTGKKVAYCSFDKLKFKIKGVVMYSYHFNFYDKDGVLFTIDHKIPKSKGGKDSFDNIQPMIYNENFEKSNNLIFT